MDETGFPMPVLIRAALTMSTKCGHDTLFNPNMLRCPEPSTTSYFEMARGGVYLQIVESQNRSQLRF
jgi:hypothetical protein